MQCACINCMVYVTYMIIKQLYQGDSSLHSTILPAMGWSYMLFYRPMPVAFLPVLISSCHYTIQQACVLPPPPVNTGHVGQLITKCCRAPSIKGSCCMIILQDRFMLAYIYIYIYQVDQTRSLWCDITTLLEGTNKCLYWGIMLENKYFFLSRWRCHLFIYF